MSTEAPIYTPEEALSIIGSIVTFARVRWNVAYVARRVFYFLREHTELLEQADYKRIYDEMAEMVFFFTQGHMGREEKDMETRKLLEQIADLFNRCNATNEGKFRKEDVDEYLRHRRAAW